MLRIVCTVLLFRYSAAQLQEIVFVDERNETENIAVTSALVLESNDSVPSVPTSGPFLNKDEYLSIGNVPPDKQELTTSETEKTTILFSNFYTLPPEEPTTERTDRTPEEEIHNESNETEEPRVLVTDPATVEDVTTESTTIPDVQYQDYDLEKLRFQQDHPCRRNCSNTKEMLCRYHFQLENYHTLSKACFDCPYNISHCYLPDCIAADGIRKSILVVNRMLPGPSIEVCEGDEIVIDVQNRLHDGVTTFHWHGQHQRESPYMDGVPFVSQCPISPLSTFRYRFKASTPGTHFWHSHMGNQRADGVFGALTVRRKFEPQSIHYDLDLAEHTIQTLDWTRQTGAESFAAHHHSNGLNKPQSLLVNGRGQHINYQDENKNNFVTPWSSFTVKKGLRYRFRLLNAGILNCPVQMSIDNHTLLAISTDGTDIEPVEVDSLVSYAGERWDFVLNADAPTDNYWIRFKGLADCGKQFNSVHSAAIIHYEGAKPETPNGELSYDKADRSGEVLNPLNEDCTNRLCMNNIKAKESGNTIKLEGEPDKKFIFTYDFYPIDNHHFHKYQYSFKDVRKGYSLYTPQINHISFFLPPFPLMSQYEDIKPGMLCGKVPSSNCSTKYCECTNVINIGKGDLVELILIDRGNTFNANHPFHLHGYLFGVVATGKLGTNTSTEEVTSLDKRGRIKRNLINPVLKDTVDVPDGGYVVLRFKADNPGYWMFHCHLEWHSEIGMALVFKVGEHSEFPPAPKGFPRCGDYLPPVYQKHKEVVREVLTNEINHYSTYNTTADSKVEHRFPIGSWWRSKNSAPILISRPFLALAFCLCNMILQYI